MCVTTAKSKHVRIQIKLYIHKKAKYYLYNGKSGATAETVVI